MTLQCIGDPNTRMHGKGVMQLLRSNRVYSNLSRGAPQTKRVHENLSDFGIHNLNRMAKVDSNGAGFGIQGLETEP